MSATYTLPLTTTIATIPCPILPILMYQNEQRPYTFEVNDANAQPVDISSDTLTFSVYTDDGVNQTLVAQLVSPTNMVISGNIATITIPTSISETPILAEYSLFDNTSSLMLAKGRFEIDATIN